MLLVTYTIVSLGFLEFVSGYRTVCYWDTSSSIVRVASYRHFNIQHLRLSLPYCKDVIAGFVPFNEAPLEQRAKYAWQAIAGSKLSANQTMYVGFGCRVSFPGPCSWQAHQALIKTGESRMNLIKNICDLVNELRFDGADLFWPFPLDIPQTGAYGNMDPTWVPYSMFRDSSKPSGGRMSYVEEAKFVLFVQDLSEELKKYHKTLTLSVLGRAVPDPRILVAIEPLIDRFNILSFDYVSPYFQPTKADYTAPLHDRSYAPGLSVASTVRWWRFLGRIPSEKIVITIPAFARTWRVSFHECPENRIPILNARGLGSRGPHTRIQGILSYYEVCPAVVKPSIVDRPMNTHGGYQLYVVDKEGHAGCHRFGTFTYSESSIWASYEHETTIRAKIEHMKKEKLAGIGIYELALDDFHGLCVGDSLLMMISQAIDDPGIL